MSGEPRLSLGPVKGKQERGVGIESGFSVGLSLRVYVLFSNHRSLRCVVVGTIPGPEDGGIVLVVRHVRRSPGSKTGSTPRRRYREVTGTTEDSQSWVAEDREDVGTNLTDETVE